MYLSMYDSKPADGIALVARDICGMAWRGDFFFEHQTKTVRNGKRGDVGGGGLLPPSSAHPACLVSNLKKHEGVRANIPLLLTTRPGVQPSSQVE